MGAVHSWEFRLRAPPTEGMPQKRETGARSRARAPRWLDRANTAGPVTRREDRKYNTSTMSHDDAEVLASALEAMPLFPLPGVVLFPGALLPLHVFELRYRAMLADCMATNRCMAMALVAGDADEIDLETEPTIAHIAGGGVVVRHTELADGRSNIVLQGRVRLALEELPFVAPYRRARARILEDIETPVSAVDRMGLHAAAAAFAGASRKCDFVLPPGISPGAAADHCAHMLVADPRARQRTLEELDVAARVRFVTAVLAEQMGLMKRESRGKPD
jgi:Lon protease-like protein